MAKKRKAKKAKKPATRTIVRNVPAVRRPSAIRRAGTRANDNLPTIIGIGSAVMTGFIKAKNIGFPVIKPIGINGTVALVAGVATLFLKPGKGRDIASALALVHGAVYAADMGSRLGSGRNLIDGDEDSVSGFGAPMSAMQSLPAGMVAIPQVTLQKMQAMLEQMNGDDDLDGDEDDLEGDDDDLEGDDDEVSGDELSLEGDDSSFDVE